MSSINHHEEKCLPFSCLNNWLQVKNLCPICQSNLINAHGETTPLLRVYTIDV